MTDSIYLHDQAHPYAGKRAYCKVKPCQEGDNPKIVEVEDWWDRVHQGHSWKLARMPAAFQYSSRAMSAGIPIDDEVVYVKVDGLGYIVHQSELTGLVGPNPALGDSAPAPISIQDVIDSKPDFKMAHIWSVVLADNGFITCSEQAQIGGHQPGDKAIDIGSIIKMHAALIEYADNKVRQMLREHSDNEQMYKEGVDFYLQCVKAASDKVDGQIFETLQNKLIMPEDL